ncbi:transposase [Caloramator quimbayensis]|uniref:Transposase n=1 Tax=Caloramator quimbayensis TaxID=1147123 RepID=A0A1T4WNC3_9CLOT|nr:transposase [Caloramator quimbayensis]
MQKYYEEEFKKKIVRLHLEEGRTLKSLAEEYRVSKAAIYI